ncbi:MAG: DUF4097 family beta strand repeat protein [Firmicutes bacterium]|nr:DUF4097 family beta strand repeat protein [Bacillota bacterium]
MTKKEYMELLKSELAGYGQEVCDDIIGEFENHFAEAEGAGLTHDEIISELGTIQEVSDNIKGMYEPPKKVNEIAPVNTVTNESCSENGVILQDVNTIEIDGDLDVKLMHGEGDGFWEYHKSASVFFDSPFWKQFWGERHVAGNESAAGLEVERSVNVLRLMLPKGTSGRLRIEVPNYVRTIRIHGKGSDVEVKDLELDEFSSAVSSGDYMFNNCNFATANIQTGSGDIESNRLFGDIKMQSNAGDIEVEDHQGPGLDLLSMAGDIEATTTSPVVSIKTQAGDVELEMRGPVIDVVVDTNAGDIDFVSVSKDYTARIKSVAGDFRNKSGLADRSQDDSWMRGKNNFMGVGGSWTIGEGNGRVSLSTTAGDVTIK